MPLDGNDVPRDGMTLYEVIVEEVGIRCREHGGGESELSVEDELQHTEWGSEFPQSLDLGEEDDCFDESETRKALREMCRFNVDRIVVQVLISEIYSQAPLYIPVRDGKIKAASVNLTTAFIPTY